MRATVFVLLFAACLAAAAADRAGTRWIPEPTGPLDHMDAAEHARIRAEIDRSLATLAPLPKAGERPSFTWPVRAARGYSSPAIDLIGNHVDHNPAFPAQLRDYQCGTRSYDLASGYNHRGTDIALFPDGWNLMDADQGEIVAAAAGVIALKADGNSDRNCAIAGQQWNAVYVRHDDGSIAWYGHMKNGSTTRKAIGERVAQGEYLGRVGSSGSSSGPHLHFEVYDANGTLVDPFAGQCNAIASWWASQPAYRSPRVNRAIVASALRQPSACGPDGQNLANGSLFEKAAFRPGQSPFFVAAVRDVEAGSTQRLTVRRPDGSLWRDIVTSPAPNFFPGAFVIETLALEADAPAGLWTLEASLGGTRATTTFWVTASGEAPPNYTDLWWNPAESGWGVNLNHQGDTLFATWFTYDGDGRGMWLVMSDARRQADGSYAGEIYRTTGVPLAQIDGAPASHSPPSRVGTGRFTFDASARRGTFAYSVGGLSQQKAIERQVFAAAATTCAHGSGDRQHATNYQDLWWNAAEPGWGLNIAHQADTLFATWFTYAADGRGEWLVASDVRREPTGEYRGRLYRTAGRPFDLISGAAAIVGSPADVGEVTLTFATGDRGRLEYVVDGVAQSKAIARQVFAGTAPLCR